MFFSGAVAKSAVNGFSESFWFGVRVKSRCEKVVAAALDGKGYRLFLPLFPPRHPKGRLAERLPIFPGYVFCNFDAKQRLPILTIPGVVMILGNGKGPVPIPEEEIEALRIVVQSELHVDRVPFLTAGDCVLIKRGPLCGLRGIVISLHECCQIVVSIQLFQRSISVKLHESWVAGDNVLPVHSIVSPSAA